MKEGFHMKSKISVFVALLVIVAVFAGCTKKAEPVAPAATKVNFKLGLVTDLGGIDDKSFNQGTWEGIVRFAKARNLVQGTDYKYLQSSAEADYVPNLSTFADEKLNLIVAPGFLFEKAMGEVDRKSVV